MQNNKKILKSVFCGLGGLGVVLGAFGAHALKNHFTDQQLEPWRTAILYLFVHVLAGLAATLLTSRLRSVYLFLVGIIFFTGSLLLLVVTSTKTLGAVAPLGGVAFILGWFFLAIDVARHPEK